MFLSLELTHIFAPPGNIVYIRDGTGELKGKSEFEPRLKKRFLKWVESKKKNSQNCIIFCNRKKRRKKWQTVRSGRKSGPLPPLPSITVYIDMLIEAVYLTVGFPRNKEHQFYFGRPPLFQTPLRNRPGETRHGGFFPWYPENILISHTRRIFLYVSLFEKAKQQH